MFGPGLAQGVERGHFLAKGLRERDHSRQWDACTASCAGTCPMARGYLSANLLLGHRASSVSSETGTARGEDCGMEFEERTVSAAVVEQGEAGGELNVLLRQKRRTGFCNKGEVVWLICHITVLSGPPICFDINTHSRAMSRHEDDAYPHTCDLQGLVLLFEE